jgi:CheY-like chemotaxis protein
VLTAAALTVALAALTLLGWAFDVTLLKSGLAGQRATQPLTAVCFLICGLSLGLSSAPGGLFRLLMRAGALGVLLFVGVTFWQNALDTDWGLDRFLFTDAVVHEQPGQYLRPGRPAAAALIALSLWCCCLLLVRRQSPLGKTLYVWFSTAGSLLTVTVLLAYAFSLHRLYAMGLYAHVGLNSGVCLATLFAGILLRRPELGWMALLTDSSVGAVSTRRLLLWTVSLLIVLTAIVQLGTSKSLYGAEFALTLITIAGIGLLCAGLLSHARRLNELETARRGFANDLRAAEAQLARAAHYKTELLAVLAHELRNPLAPLRNGIEIVRQLSATDKTLTRTVNMMGRQMDHLVRLVDGLLEHGGEFKAADTDAAAGKPTAGQPAADEAVLPTKKLRVLVADDNADAAASLALLLQIDGHEVQLAFDGRKAVELARLFLPDIIFMDLGMPLLDGAEAAREIREQPWGQSVRIVALTGWGHEAERRRTEAAGFDLHLVKPVDPRALAAILMPDQPP